MSTRRVNMDTLEAYVTQLEKKLAENTLNNVKKTQLFNGINNLNLFISELDQLIKELQETYEQTKNPEDKKKLDKYLNMQLLYETSIQCMVKDYQEYKSKTEMEDLESAQQLVTLFKERKERLEHLEKIERNTVAKEVEVRNYQNQKVLIAKKDQEQYQQLFTQIEQLDKQIQQIFEQLKEDEENDYEYEVEIKEAPLPCDERKNLENRYQEILEQLQEIEHTKGKKIHFKTTYQGKQYIKDIPARKRYAYGRLLAELLKVESEIKMLDKIPPVVFDEEKYEAMSPMQKKTYLANLILLIENLPRRLNMAYINKHYIPLEYEALYKKLLKMLIVAKKEKDYEIDESYVSHLSPEDQVQYYTDLMEQIFKKEPVSQTVHISLTDGNNTRFYIIDKDCARTFEKCWQRRLELLEQIEKEVQDAKTQEATPENKAYQEALEKALDTRLQFDQVYYDSLTDEQQIDYCKNLLNAIILQEVKNPVEMVIDRQRVVIDKPYVKSFTLASEKILDRKDNHLDIEIDEEYVKTLTPEKEATYYLLLMKQIAAQKITNPVRTDIENKTFIYDEKYCSLFEKIQNRYMKIDVQRQEPVKVEAKKKTTKLEQIKKSLRKKAVQIGLALSIMANVATMGVALSGSRKYEPVSEVTVQNHQSQKQPTIHIVNEQPEPEKEAEQKPVNYFGQNFILHNNASIYIDDDFSKPYTPLYKSDMYTTVGVLLQMPDQTIIKVNYQDDQANEMVNQALLNGASIIARTAVAASGMNDYIKNGIETGTFKEEDLTKLNAYTNLQELLADDAKMERSL